MKNKRKMIWMLVLIIIGLMIGSYFLILHFPDCAEVIFILWCVVAGIICVIARINMHRTIRKEVQKLMTICNENKIARAPSKAPEPVTEIKTKDYFVSSNMNLDEKKRMNLLVEVLGMHRVLMDESLVKDIVKKILEMGENDLSEENYCYMGVADREEKIILTRYHNFWNQEGIREEKYIVMYKQPGNEFKGMLLKTETDGWGEETINCRIEADVEKIYEQVKEFIVPAIVYMDKADGLPKFESEAEEQLGMACSDYRHQNYIKFVQENQI